MNSNEFLSKPEDEAVPCNPGEIADEIRQIETYISQLEEQAKELLTLLIDQIRSLAVNTITGDGYRCDIHQRINIDVDLSVLPEKYTKHVDDKTKIRQALKRGWWCQGRYSKNLPNISFSTL